MRLTLLAVLSASVAGFDFSPSVAPKTAIIAQTLEPYVRLLDHNDKDTASAMLDNAIGKATTSYGANPTPSQSTVVTTLKTMKNDVLAIKANVETAQTNADDDNDIPARDRAARTAERRGNGDGRLGASRSGPVT